MTFNYPRKLISDFYADELFKKTTGHDPDQNFYWYKHALLPENGPFTHYKIWGGSAPPITKGRNKREPNHTKRDRSKDHTFIWKRADFDLWLVDWTRRTNQCADCLGSGKTIDYNSQADELVYQDCSYCFATGKADVAAQVAVRKSAQPSAVVVPASFAA